MHYARYEPVPRNPTTGYPIVSEALSHKCILRVRILTPILAADISLHNVGTRKFFDEIAKSPHVKYSRFAAPVRDRPSPRDRRDEVAYFLLPDRFSDGNGNSRPFSIPAIAAAFGPADFQWDFWAQPGSDRYQ